MKTLKGLKEKMMSELSDRIPVLQEQVVVIVEAVQKQKEEKKTMAKSYNETIKALEAERDTLLLELNATKDQVKQEALVEKADDIIKANASPGGETHELIL